MSTHWKGLLFCAATALLLPTATGQTIDGIDFGDDEGVWVFDGECDDPRFSGSGMAEILDEEDSFHDATDCAEAYSAGTITFGQASAKVPLTNSMRPSSSTSISTSGVDFGDDDSFFAFDDECDDARFIGEGLTETKLIESDIGHDATDCEAAFDAGTLRLRGAGDPPVEDVLYRASEDDDWILDYTNEDFDAPPADGIIFNGINFGDNTSEWANDEECDDPRFDGDGMTDTILLAEDAFHDANDCLAAWKTGGLGLSD